MTKKSHEESLPIQLFILISIKDSVNYSDRELKRKNLDESSAWNEKITKSGLDLCFYYYHRVDTSISNLMHTTCFWNNLHHVLSKSKDWKAKKFKSQWEQINQRAKLIMVTLKSCFTGVISL
jgi:hypothetical protein